MSIDNGQIQRSFKIPKQTPLGNAATSVATNGTFVAIDWNPQLLTNFAKSESIRLKKIADGDAFVKKGNELEEAANNDTNKERTISDEQVELFISLLKDYPKIPIKVFVNPEDVESVKYARKIRHLLDSAGYRGGLMPVGGDIYITTNSVKFSPALPHTLVYFALPEKKFGWVIPISTPFDSIKPVISSGLTNDPGIFAIGSLDCVKWAFSGIGLNGFYTSSTNLLQYGEVGIFVPRKAK